jgi:predicted amidohydrolase
VRPPAGDGRPLRTALVQMDIAWENWRANHARAASHVGHAAEAGARLVVLPEMFATGFSMDTARIAQPEGGPTEQWLAETARAHGVHLIAGVAVQREPLPVNEALLVSPEGEVSRFAKLHPFSFAREDRVFGPGEQVVTWKVEGVRITPLVCYDLRFPEPFRLAAAATDAFVVIANWPDRRRLHWSTLLRARAIENLCYVLGVNRVGEGSGLAYAGDSAIHDPWGETLASAAGQEALLLADLDPAKVARTRETFPALGDVKPRYTR